MMPFARLTLNSSPAPEMAQDLAAKLTDLIARDLKKRRDLTSVLVESVGAGNWVIGATESVTNAHLEVCVTAGTNSEQEKRTFVANAMFLLRSTFPGLDPATYVVINQLPASDWGFNGLTQADRASKRALEAV